MSSTQNTPSSDTPNMKLDEYDREEPSPPIKDDDSYDTRPLTTKSKTYVVGCRNITGKDVIQDFLNCAGTISLPQGTMVETTRSYSDAIFLLTRELERKFTHLHPS